MYVTGFNLTLLNTIQGKMNAPSNDLIDERNENHTALLVVQVLDCSEEIIGSGYIISPSTFATASELIDKMCYIRAQTEFGSCKRDITQKIPKGSSIILANVSSST